MLGRLLTAGALVLIPLAASAAERPEPTYVDYTIHPGNGIRATIRVPVRDAAGPAAAGAPYALSGSPSREAAARRGPAVREVFVGNGRILLSDR